MSKNVTSPVKANEPESFMEMVNLFNEIQRQVMVKHGNSDLTMALAQVIENEINDELDKLFQSKIIKDLVVDRDAQSNCYRCYGRSRKTFVAGYCQ